MNSPLYTWMTLPCSHPPGPNKRLTLKGYSNNSESQNSTRNAASASSHPKRLICRLSCLREGGTSSTGENTATGELADTERCRRHPQLYRLHQLLPKVRAQLCKHTCADLRPSPKRRQMGVGRRATESPRYGNPEARAVHKHSPIQTCGNFSTSTRMQVIQPSAPPCLKKTKRAKCAW